jgi:hypothetical protein
LAREEVEHVEKYADEQRGVVKLLTTMKSIQRQQDAVHGHSGEATGRDERLHRPCEAFGEFAALFGKSGFRTNA